MLAAASSVAASDGVVSDLLVKAGGLAAAAALVGLLLVLPLFLAHRREVDRLLDWQRREPEKGDGGRPEVPRPADRPAAGALTAAARVTAERPAMDRITSERAALAEASFAERLVALGPRHPLVISGAALAFAITAVVAVSLLLSVQDDDSGGRGGGLDRSEVDVVVLNGSSKPALARKVADTIEAAEFSVVGTAKTGSSRQTLVLFNERRRREARAVARELGVEPVIQPFDAFVRDAAKDADVVVIAGEDRARA